MNNLSTDSQLAADANPGVQVKASSKPPQASKDHRKSPPETGFYTLRHNALVCCAEIKASWANKMTLTFLSPSNTPIFLIQALLEGAIRHAKQLGKTSIEVLANTDERNVLDVGQRLGFRCFLDPDDDHEVLLAKRFSQQPASSVFMS